MATQVRPPVTRASATRRPARRSGTTSARPISASVVHAPASQLTARGIVVVTVLGSVVIAMVDAILNGHVGLMFDICFVLVCITSALAVEPRDGFTAAVMPPIVFGATMAVLSPFVADRLSPAATSTSQGFLGGLAAHASWLVTAYVVTLLVTAARSRDLG
jgi:hypothetical protein